MCQDFFRRTCCGCGPIAECVWQARQLAHGVWSWKWGTHASHGAHVASKMTFNQLSISTRLLHARCTELLTDPHAPGTSPLRIVPQGPLRAPEKVHHAHQEVGMACMAVTIRSMNIFDIVWSQSAFAHFTGSRSLSSRWLQPPLQPVGRPAGQVAWSDENGHVASQGRMGPLK